MCRQFDSSPHCHILLLEHPVCSVIHTHTLPSKCFFTVEIFHLDFCGKLVICPVHYLYSTPPFISVITLIMKGNDDTWYLTSLFSQSVLHDSRWHNNHCISSSVWVRVHTSRFNVLQLILGFCLPHFWRRCCKCFLWACRFVHLTNMLFIKHQNPTGEIEDL